MWPWISQWPYPLNVVFLISQSCCNYSVYSKCEGSYQLFFTVIMRRPQPDLQFFYIIWLVCEVMRTVLINWREVSCVPVQVSLARPFFCAQKETEKKNKRRSLTLKLMVCTLQQNHWLTLSLCSHHETEFELHPRFQRSGDEGWRPHWRSDQKIQKHCSREANSEGFSSLLYSEFNLRSCSETETGTSSHKITVLRKVSVCFTWLEIMAMWLKAPWMLCFKGAMVKNAVESLENTGFWFYNDKNQQ